MSIYLFHVCALKRVPAFLFFLSRNDDYDVTENSPKLKCDPTEGNTEMVNKIVLNSIEIKIDILPGSYHRYRKSQNRLLKVCCVPSTSTSLPMVSFFFSFFVAVAIYSTNKAYKAGSTCH